MTRLAGVSGRQAVKALQKIGYQVRNQVGSHVQLRKPGGPPLTVPDHHPVGVGTLRAIIRQSGLSVKEFLALL